MGNSGTAGKLIGTTGTGTRGQINNSFISSKKQNCNEIRCQ